MDFAADSNGSLNLYSGSRCEDFNPLRINGSADGLCTQIAGSFWSFQINTLDPGCGVTVYARDNPYCGKGRRYEISPGQCIGNDTSISQFSVDCQSRDITPTTSPASSSPGDGGVSTSAKIATATAVPIGTLALMAIVAWLFIKRRRSKKLEATKQEPSSPVPVETEGKTAFHEVDDREVGQRYEIGDEARRQSMIIELDSEWTTNELQGTTAAGTSDSGTKDNSFHDQY